MPTQFILVQFITYFIEPTILPLNHSIFSVNLEDPSMNVDWFSVLRIQNMNYRSNLASCGIFNQLRHSKYALQSVRDKQQYQNGVNSFSFTQSNYYGCTKLRLQCCHSKKYKWNLLSGHTSYLKYTVGSIHHTINQYLNVFLYTIND